MSRKVGQGWAPSRSFAQTLREERRRRVVVFLQLKWTEAFWGMEKRCVGQSFISWCPGPRGAGQWSSKGAVPAQAASGLRASRTRGCRLGRCRRRGSTALALLLSKVDLGVALPLVAPGKLAATVVAGEGLLPGVGADVSGEVVTSAEVPHADATLEGLVARVDSDVPGQLIRAGEPPVTAFGWTRVGPLVHWRLAGPVRVLSGPQDGSQRQVMRVIGGRGHCCRATPGQSGSLTASTCPWSRDSGTGTPQSKITDGGEWSERRGDPQGVQRAGKWLSIRASCTMWISLARRWEKSRIVWDHRNETWIHGWLGGWVGRRWLVGQRGGGSRGW